MADRDGPLAGLKVLDLTEHMAGPFCTMILADMGAEVVKLERPGKGDSVRAWGDGSERNPYFRYINRNKKGITLDYKQPEGKTLFLRLVEGMDVLVENYRPTVKVRHRGLVQYASDPELGEVPHIRTPVKIGEGVRVRNVAPKLGQKNAEIFGRLGVKDVQIKELSTKSVL
jgi:crotonobetainyl-CoA:carnitine CoA-transferase CaiB-like acyl-CoA transferase